MERLILCRIKILGRKKFRFQMVGVMPFRFQIFGRIAIIVWRMISSQTVQKLSSQPFHKLSSLVVHEISGQLVHEHPAVNPISAGSLYMVALYTARIFEFFIEHILIGPLKSAAVCGEVALASSPSQPLFFFLSLFYQCDGCLKWELIAWLLSII